MGAFLLSGWAPGTDPRPTSQDIQIAGHVLFFQEKPVAGAIILAIVYDPAQGRSRDEATALAALIGNGLSVGDAVLHARLVEQAQLAETTGYRAIFSTIGVDEGLLGGVLQQHQVPCLTRHLEQVEHGSCTVAIASEPSVSIVVNVTNAANASVRFATAFRMMVREL